MRDRIGKILGVPADAVGFSNGFMAELRGRSAISVRGCRRILSYSRERICLDTRDGTVTVLGEALFCVAYFSDAIGIEGRIDAVFFEDRRDAIARCFSGNEEGGSKA